MKTFALFISLVVALWGNLFALTTVTAVSPAQHALNVSATTAVQVTFSSALLAGSFNDTTSFIVSGMNSGRHLGAIVLSNGNTMATFTPATAFAKGEIVTVALTSNLKDADSTAIVPFTYTFTVNANRASGSYAAKVDHFTTSNEIAYTEGLLIHDIDGDADGDIVVMNNLVQDFEDLEHTSSIVKMENNGDESFVQSDLYTTEPSSFNAPSIISVLVSDVDGDGDGDIVVAIAEVGNNRVSILKNNGNGTFGSINSVSGSIGNPIMSIFVSDVDGDGDGDIAVGRYPNIVSILKNNGDGTFAAKVDYTTGSNDAYSVFISDLDNDGDGDIAVADYDTTTGNISVLKNNGDGTFGAAVDYATGFQPSNLVVSDIDGDGDGDIVTANSISATVSVLKNNGNGTFAANVDYTTGSTAYDVSIGDVDGDGDGDIVVGNVSVATVSVLKNNGDGTFAAKADFTTGGAASAVFVSDIDGDGIVDIISANNSARTISVLMGRLGPSVSTGSVEDITINSATVNGAVIANDASTTVRFLYGTTSGTYTDSVTSPQSSVNGTANTPVSGSLSGLLPGTTYYFRIAAGNVDAYVRGGELNFTTLTTSPSVTTSAASNIGRSTARANGVVNANNASTTVRFLYGTVSGTYTDSVTATQSPLSGTANTSVSSVLSGLTSNTIYFFRVAASNVNGYVRGSELSFTPDSTGAVFGNALQFDGMNDYVDLENSADFSVGTAVTYEAWINPDTMQTGWILNKWVSAVEDKQLMLSGDHIYFYLHNVFNGAQLGSSSAIPIGEFTHIAATYNSSTGSAKLYINGVLDTSKTVGNDVSNSFGGLFIGHNAVRVDGVYPFKGIMDEIRIWNVARTESEIQSTMNTPLTGNETGLVGYWNFDEGSGTTTADLTINGNDGTISGAAWISSTVPLPVELTSFSASEKQNGVELKWKTATEVNNYGFEIERASLNPSKGGTFEAPLREVWGAIGFVEGAGTSNSPKEYSFSDSKLRTGKYSYRLKQIDRDGKFSYSQEVEANVGSVPKIFALEQNYPNPFNPSTTIGFTLQVSGMTSLKVYDMLGREVATLVNEHLEAGVYHQKTFNASALASGIYFARLQSEGKVMIRKMLLVK